MAEEGYFALQLTDVALQLNLPLAADANWRIDIEIKNSHSIFQWLSTNDVKWSTGKFKPVLQEQADGSSSLYLYGFDGQFLRSNYVELNTGALSVLCNAVVSIKVFTLNEAPAAAPAKAAKGAPPPPVIPAEEVLVEINLPLASILTMQGNAILLDRPVSEVEDLSFVLHPSVLPSSTLRAHFFADNDLAEYVLGCKLISWQTASLPAPPAGWTLHAADAVDPKAKVPPTAAELRAKYIDNISKLIDIQSKVAVFSLEVGVKEGAEGIAAAFPVLPLTSGTIAFNAAQAASVPLDEDIRSRVDLWSIAWGTSPCIFFHRAAVRHLVQQISAEPSNAFVPLTVKKTPFPEYVPVEGGEVFATALLDISGIVSPGRAVLTLSAQLVGDAEGPLTVRYAVTAPLVALSQLGKWKQQQSMTLPKHTVVPDRDARDALQELRDEISKCIERIAQEYVSQNPTAVPSAVPLAVDTTVVEDPKTQFLHYLATSGVFHDLQERMRPAVELIIQERYGSRGRALGRSDVLRQADTSQEAVDESILQSVLSELYVFLVKECNLVLNKMFATTVVQKIGKEIEKPAVVDDCVESLQQIMSRLLRQAVDAAADQRPSIAEEAHLERLAMLDSNESLYNDKTVVHDAYLAYATYLLAQAAGNGDQTLVKRAREALTVAAGQIDSLHTFLLQAVLLIECDQPEAGEQILHRILAMQLPSYSLTSFDDMSGYESDGLCPAHPRVYAVLAALFSMQSKPLLVRKALLMANRCYAEWDEGSDLSTHGTPRRTVVLLLAETSIYLSQYAACKLSNACYTLMNACEEAVMTKAKVKGRPAVSPAHIRYLVKRAAVEASLGLYPPLDVQAAVDAGKQCAMLAEDPADQVSGHLVAARACLRGGDLEASLEHYLSAVGVAKDRFSPLKAAAMLPLEALLTVGKLLQQYGRFEEAVQVLLYGAQVHTSSSICLQLGSTFLRLERLPEAEEALTEANLLDNRNAEIWAMLSILCIARGAARVHEAEQALFQALRLGLSSPALLRELSMSFMSIDKLQTAEDLLRRALASEGRRNPHTRKLLADVLAGQHLAAKAVDEYKAVLLDDAADKSIKLSVADKCLALLSSMGRDDELSAVRGIIATLEGGGAEQ